uniref:Protein FAR1-RELATED SEQUENCE n=1 Tax=Ananas comosus var. bracteatus TaxID=296719 RepID=A0A6V7NS88_ANACO|nr:unnamed protein product [Ananas comosus var. bracteatus]
MFRGSTELDNANFGRFWVQPRIVFAAAVRSRLVVDLRSAGEEQWLNVVMENSSPTVIPLACTMHDANTTYQETTNAECTNLETNSEDIISNASVDRINEPYVGMGFNSLCDAENFYKVFAKQQVITFYNVGQRKQIEAIDVMDMKSVSKLILICL